MTPAEKDALSLVMTERADRMEEEFLRVLDANPVPSESAEETLNAQPCVSENYRTPEFDGAAHDLARNLIESELKFGRLILEFDLPGLRGEDALFRIATDHPASDGNPMAYLQVMARKTVGVTFYQKGVIVPAEQVNAPDVPQAVYDLLESMEWLPGNWQWLRRNA